MLRILAFFLLVASVFDCAAAIAQDAPPKSGFEGMLQTGSAVVTGVIDPRTVQLKDGRIIRLSGLDFPDFDSEKPGELSVTALRVLRDMLIGEAVNVYQTMDKKRGRVNRFDHHLAHLARTRDGAWIQGALLSLGLARVRTTAANPELAPGMYALESAARAAKAGLWSLPVYAVAAPLDLKNRPADGFMVAEGTIQAAALNKNRIFLNFGDDWRADFTVAIAPEHKRAFAKAGLDPLSWNGQTVRVRGWVRDYNGPFMEIDHPEAIELTGAATPPQN